MSSLEETLAGRREKETPGWAPPLRIVLKAALLFLLLNLLFGWLNPLETLGRLSLYNTLFPGRLRLPYGELPSEDYNLTLNNIPAMLASHVVAQPKADDEFRILVIGDSGTWGWLLENEDTLAGQLNRLGLETADGRRITAYNLGYPVLAVTKDLVLLDAAMPYEPDLILWPVTLDSFPIEKQLTHPLLQNNPGRVRPLIAQYNLNLDPDDERFVDPNFWQRTITGRRRELADLLRLQGYGVSWAATGIDQSRPDEITLRRSDFDEDFSWQEFEAPATLRPEDLSIEVLNAGVQMAGEIPVLIVNEPMFISDGENSDLRYNAFYPRWAYDQYRDLLAANATEEGWHYLDLWDQIPAQEFTDTPVHMSPVGTAQFAELLQPAILKLSGN